MKWSVLIIVFYYIMTKSCAHKHEEEDPNSTKYTAIEHMHTFVETVLALTSYLDMYIETQKYMLNSLEWYLNEFKNLKETAIKDINEHYNPISAFVIIKKLVIDWGLIENTTYAMSENSKSIRKLFEFPMMKDLQGAAAGLDRIQDTYNLNFSNIVEGELNDVKYNTKLTANDCFMLGSKAYENSNYHHCAMWMQEAKRQLDPKQIDRIDMAFIHDYLEICKKLNTTVKQKLHGEYNDQDEYKEELDSYRKLCQGEELLSPQENSNLRCKYITNNNPLLKIGPIKIEEASLDPLVVVFHDVLYDSEIIFFKQINRVGWGVMQVDVDTKTGKEKISRYRTGKAAWFPDYLDKTVAKVSKRIQAMTGLDLDLSEDYQVFNYGIGGQYLPHLDVDEEPELTKRLATVLLYMNDVEQGGATVFPLLKRKFVPKKGTAVFWYNFLVNGKIDNRTLHASCPVISGSKWIATKWIHKEVKFLQQSELRALQYPT